jgi:hypothetical protein
MKLTGLQRCQLTLAWVKRGREGNKEDWIKAVCKAKDIEYVEPRKVER